MKPPCHLTEGGKGQNQKISLSQQIFIRKALSQKRKVTFSESSLQDLFNKSCLVVVVVREIKILATKDNCS